MKDIPLFSGYTRDIENRLSHISFLGRSLIIPSLTPDKDIALVSLAYRSNSPIAPILLPLKGQRDEALTRLTPDEYDVSVTVATVRDNYIAISILEDPYDLWFIATYSNEGYLLNIADITYIDIWAEKNDDESDEIYLEYQPANDHLRKAKLLSALTCYKHFYPDDLEHIKELEDKIANTPDDPSREESLRMRTEEYMTLNPTLFPY